MGGERKNKSESFCLAAQGEPRVEVVFLPPMVSLGLCVCLCVCSSLGPSEGARGTVEGGRKREQDGGRGGQRGSGCERCRFGPMAKQKGGEEREGRWGMLEVWGEDGRRGFKFEQMGRCSRGELDAVTSAHCWYLAQHPCLHVVCVPPNKSVFYFEY